MKFGSARQQARKLKLFRQAFEPVTLSILESCDVFLVANDREVSLLLLDKGDPRGTELLGDEDQIAARVVGRGERSVDDLVVLDRRLDTTDTVDRLSFVRAVLNHPEGFHEWIARKKRSSDLQALSGQVLLTKVLADPALLEFYACSYRSSGLGPTEPFRPGVGPARLPAQPKRRSVLFLEHSYYNFYYLARALRARGWDALSITTTAPDASDTRFFHGQDLRIHHPDSVEHQNRVMKFFEGVPDRFGIVHGYGVGVLSAIPGNRDVDSSFDRIPWDILALKRRGVLIGYSHSGCLDAVSQTTFRSWSPSLCANCAWADRPDICSDERNLNWGRKIVAVADLICIETEPALDLKNSPNAFPGPLTFAMDPDIWAPGLTIPSHLKRERSPDEVVVYHAVGNYALRTRNQKNVKGTGAVIDAVERLRQEGIRIRLDFVHDVPSMDNRFVQSQADIIVDQLNYGRYGALAREAMMLGKPVVGRLNRFDGPGIPATQCILESPIVDADEDTVSDVLRELALNPERRAAIGLASREHAMHWWSADRLAARFEQVYDHVRETGRPPHHEDVP
jgi:hypothetical protein